MPIKKLHIVWVGDETKRPDTYIQTWRNMNPDWDIRVWGNHEYETYPWVNKAKMEEMWHSQKELNGVADIMRWEILRDHGGFAVDADSICVRPLEDWLFDAPMVVSYENEQVRPNLLAAGYTYAEPRHPLLLKIIQDITDLPTVTGERAWQTVGPLRLTKSYYQNPQAYQLKILPSCHFIPTHYSGAKGQGNGPVFAIQYWGSTKATYDTMYSNLPGVQVNLNGQQHNLYFVHRLLVNEQRQLNRLAFFAPLLKGAKVLHVGFVDYPITTFPGNLHADLSQVTKEIVGYDVNRLGADIIQAHMPENQRRMYFNFQEIQDEVFDWVLVPEVLEHVDNMKDFLTQISSVKAKRFAFSVPDAFALPHFYQKTSPKEAYEVVHPDHNCWFSPYTLTNVIQKYTKLKVRALHRINISIVALCEKETDFS
jgi:Glycosyltransferase sugar-binding region containing DXD motif